jgi:perosamine synthetase
MNKKISWWVPKMGTKEYEYIKEVLEKDYPNEGYLTKEFENKICKLVGSKYAVAVTSGTSALFLALKALGVGHGDNVLVPAFTFIASANAVKMTGATPIFVDINSKNANIDTNALTQAITPKTKAIMPVHVSGRGADMQAIKTIAKQHNLAIVEDAAEAFMSKYKGQFLGTWGDLGCFSFSPHKIITTGQGGMVVTNNEELYKKLILLKDHGRPIKGTGGDDVHHCVGYNFKLTNLQAAVGLGQLELLNQRVKRAKEIYSLYKKLLNNNPKIHIFDFDTEQGEVPLWTDAICEQRDELQSYLKNHSIDARNYWHPLHTQIPYRMSDDTYPQSIEVAKKGFWLPSNFTMTDSDVEYVCTTINNFFNQNENLAWTTKKESRYQS